MEQFRGPEPERRPEAKETEVVRREFVYRDAKGEVLGRAAIELEGPEVEMDYATVKEGKPGRGRKLRSFVIKGEKPGGLPGEIDMMALARAEGIEVIASSEHLQNYSYNDESKVALVPPLETPLDVGVFLHELGHADQYREDRFAKITPLYGRSKPLAVTEQPKISYNTLADLLEAVSEAVPDAKKVLDHEALGQLRRLEDRRHDALDRKTRAERALDEQEAARRDELASLIMESLRSRVDIDALVAQCDQLVAAERFAAAPLVASGDVAALVDRLTDVGIRFEEEYHEDALGSKKEGAKDVAIPAEIELPEKILSESMVTTAEQAKELLRQVVLEISPGNSDLRYDDAAEELIVRTMYHANGGRWMVALRVDVDRDDFKRYALLRERTDVQVRFLEQKSDAAYEDAKVAAEAQQMLLDAVNVRDIAALPTRMMERDATRRALQWLRTVRQKTGVDLLAPHLVPPEALAATGKAIATDEACISSTAEGLSSPAERNVEASVVSDLKNALASYGADKMRLHPPDDESGPGMIPVAGRERG